jgi:hypothetical protein
VLSCQRSHGTQDGHCSHVFVQGTSSNILVRLSNVYSQLRGDTSGIKNEDSAQVNLLHSQHGMACTMSCALSAC